MNWVKANEVVPELGQTYLVWTNGGEWNDSFIHVWPAPLLAHHLKAEITRGRPLYVAKVVAPIGGVTASALVTLPALCAVVAFICLVLA